MTGRVLTERALNRALLARQLLLERSRTTIVEVVEQVGGLQTQYAPSGYVGLWTRLVGFQRDDLTRALEAREVIQATLLRTTIHVVSRREFWRYAVGIRRARRAWLLRVRRDVDEADLVAHTDELRAVLAGGPKSVRELGDLGGGFIGNLGLFVDLVRVPPSGTWERRRADRLALAESWVGPEDATEAEGLTHIVRAYLRGFGPASWKEIAAWAGIAVADAKRGGEGLTLAHFRAEDGRALVDLPGADLPDPGTPAPVRFLPHWDANLLAHARRTGVLPVAHQPRVFSTRNPFSVGAVLVDGYVAGSWSIRDGRVEVTEFEELSSATRRAVEREREALEAFHR